MAVELVRSAVLAGRAPSYAARVTAGHLVFTAGACPLDPAGEIGPLHDYSGQAALVMANLRTALAVALLGYENQLVEVEAVAAVGTT